MKKDPNIIRKGYLDVGDGHKIYWEEWGSPNAPAIMHFHGGPGGGFHDGHKLLFNPLKQRVIFFDQRGAGKSTPYATTKTNTTQNLISDTERLREHLKIDKMYLVGGSWGSTMALLYALEYPDWVVGMILWGIYLGRQFENDLISEGYAKYNYPEAWERFISLVPESHRENGAAITEYYAAKLASQDKKEAQHYADEWTLWESSLVSLSYDQRKLEQDTIGDPNNLPLAILETYYFLNSCFIPENHILDNISKISQLPAYVIQGRLDQCTPPISAYELAKAYGKNLTLQWVNAGHRRNDPELIASLRTAINLMCT